MSVLKQKKRSYVKHKKVVTAKVRKILYKKGINLHTDKLSHGTIPQIAKEAGMKKEKTYDYIKVLRNNAKTCLNSIAEDNFVGLPYLRGCYKNGVDEECDNCCAISSIDVMKENDRECSDIYKSITHQTKDGLKFNGKIHIDPSVLTKIQTGKKCINYMLCYTGEISLADVNTLYTLLQLPFDYPMHNFIFVTKFPKVLWNKMLPGIQLLNASGRDIHSVNNIHIVASVGMDKYKHRIDELRLFEGFMKHVWYKPLLEAMSYHNLSGIDSIRMAVEKAKRPRPAKLKWVIDIMRTAEEQGVKAFYDPTSNEQRYHNMRTTQSFQRILDMMKEL